MQIAFDRVYPGSEAITMRDDVRRSKQALARELGQQLFDAVPEPYVETPEEKALLDAYEASFIASYDDDDDAWDETVKYEDFDEDFDCNCELCRMQDFG